MSMDELELDKRGFRMKEKAIEKLLPRSNYSVYGLVRMAARRALELSEGKPSLIKNVDTDKLASIALEEILQGKIETKAAAQSREKESSKKGSKKREAN